MPRYNLTHVEILLWLSRQHVPQLVATRRLAPQSHKIRFQMKKNTSRNGSSPIVKRSVFVGAKVTPEQKAEIQSFANQCGMTVSDYLLARAYNYKPKARLTKEEIHLLQKFMIQKEIFWTAAGLN